MNTTSNNLRVGATYIVTCKTSKKSQTVILRKIGNANHKNPIHMAARINRLDFVMGYRANEYIWEMVK